MIPTGLRHPSLAYIENMFDPADFINNLFLYMPVGIVLSGSSLRRAFVYGLLLSTCAEVLQLGFVDRIPSFVDILSNTSGALIGYAGGTIFSRATGYDPKSVRISRPFAAGAVIVAILGVVTLVHHRPKSDFSNWNPGFRLAIGNELTGDRPWRGTASQLQIYPLVMSPSQVNDIALRINSSGSADHAFSELPSGGLLPPADLSKGAGQPLFSREEERTLFDALVQRGQLTLLISMRPDSMDQIGPARVVTYSQDGFNRNFTLGQIHNALTFRLRTPDSGLNGTSPALYSGPVLSLNRTSFVAVTYDGRFSRLYVDGKWAAQADLGAKRPHLPWRFLRWLPGSIPIHQIELIASEMLFSGLFALGIFALWGVPGRSSKRFVAGAMAGAAIGAVIWLFGVSQPKLGMHIFVECVAASMVIAASVETETAA
jgi:VanZ like family/Concanavalin A-like lectin/glucanases superfamily